MTTNAPRPVAFTSTTNPGNLDPVPLALIGGLPAGSTPQGAAVADATVATDGTSAGTQLNALLASLRAAGIIAS